MWANNTLVEEQEFFDTKSDSSVDSDKTVEDNDFAKAFNHEKPIQETKKKKGINYNIMCCVRIFINAVFVAMLIWPCWESNPRLTTTEYGR